MVVREHGISLGIHRIENQFFLRLVVQGKLTHDDYTLMTPMLDQALAGIADPDIKMLVECRQFEGWELRAAWDDFRLGLKHGSKFGRIAIVGDKPWEKAVARIGSWFIEGEMQFFEDSRQALRWLEL